MVDIKVPQLYMTELAKGVECTQALLILTTAGADPAVQLRDAAAASSRRLHEVC